MEPSSDDAATVDKRESMRRSLSKPLPPSPLNTTFRKGLYDFAITHGLEYSQDLAGNIFIARPGTNRGSPGIALQFPLDSPSRSFGHARFVFIQIQNVSLDCDLVLVGWTSPDGRLIGREVWDGTTTLSAAQDEFPDLKAFSGSNDVTGLSLGAILEVKETDVEAIEVLGPPVLVDAVKKAMNSKVKKPKEDFTELRRAPMATIRGTSAIDVANATVLWFSANVSKFGNSG